MSKFGYPTDKKCELCGSTNDNQIEPRFLYVACRDCQNLTPVEFSHRLDHTTPTPPH